MWGIIPAAGQGSRIQPLAFSKELLPVGGRYDGKMRRPRAVSDYLMERMALGGGRPGGLPVLTSAKAADKGWKSCRAQHTIRFSSSGVELQA